MRSQGSRFTSVRITVAFMATALLAAALLLWAVQAGGLDVDFVRLLKGIFVEYDRDVAVVFDLRFPRIAVALLGGMLMSASGVLMQAVMRNPLADPGIIGVTAGASVTSSIVIMLFPALSIASAIFSFVGGMGAFALVYILAWNGNVSPVRLILVGVALDACLSGIDSAFSVSYTGAASVVNGNISLMTWDDAGILLAAVCACLVLSMVFASRCDLLALSDQTVHSLGVSINRSRVAVSIISVLMASIFTSVIGSVSFLGLLVPHIARLLVGSAHKVLIPYSALLGAVIFLFADTVGRTIAYPYEISAAIIMAVIGGPAFIILLRRSRQIYG